MPITSNTIKSRLLWLSGFNLLAFAVINFMLMGQISTDGYEKLEAELDKVVADFGTNYSWEKMNYATHQLRHDIDSVREAAFGLHEKVAYIQSNDSLAPQDKRNLIADLSKTTLQNNHLILGVYTNFIADGLDGSDLQFVDSEYSNEIGRYTPYFTLNKDGSVNTQVMTESDFVETVKDRHGKADNYWYTCVFETKKPCVINVYTDDVQGALVQMFSYALPVTVDGNVVGVVGVDTSLRDTSMLVNILSQQLFDGKANIVLVDQNEDVLAHSGKLTAPGKQLKDVEEEYALYRSMMKTEKHGSFAKSKSEKLLVYAPVPVLTGEQPFGLFAHIPQVALYEQTQHIRSMLVDLENANLTSHFKITLAYLILTVIFYFFAIREMSKPLSQLVKDLRISSGNGACLKRSTKLPKGKDERYDLVSGGAERANANGDAEEARSIVHKAKNTC